MVSMEIWRRTKAGSWSTNLGREQKGSERVCGPGGPEVLDRCLYFRREAAFCFLRGLYHFNVPKAALLISECWVALISTRVPGGTNQHPDARMDKPAPDAG
jgi:hypothetical protein